MLITKEQISLDDGYKIITTISPIFLNRRHYNYLIARNDKNIEEILDWINPMESFEERYRPEKIDISKAEIVYEGIIDPNFGKFLFEAEIDFKDTLYSIIDDYMLWESYDMDGYNFFDTLLRCKGKIVLIVKTPNLKGKI